MQAGDFLYKIRKFYEKFKCILPIFLFSIYSFLIIAFVPDQYDEAISLGPNCQPAHQLRLNNLRCRAYPFDYNITPFNGLLKFLTWRGVNFLDFDKIVPIDSGEAVVIQDLTYEITAVHDFLSLNQFFTEYEQFKAKYDRRVKRFFEVLDSNKRILFVRKYMIYEEAVLLDHILRVYYPHLSYTILALGHTEEAKNDWQLERVRNFYLRELEPFFWAGDDVAWKEILDQFRVAKPQANDDAL